MSYCRFSVALNFLGSYQFESNNEETFIGKRSSWRYYAICNGNVASAEYLKKDTYSGNNIVVNENDDYKTKRIMQKSRNPFGLRLDSVKNRNINYAHFILPVRRAEACLSEYFSQCL